LIYQRNAELAPNYSWICQPVRRKPSLEAALVCFIVFVGKHTV